MIFHMWREMSLLFTWLLWEAIAWRPKLWSITCIDASRKTNIMPVAVIAWRLRISKYTKFLQNKTFSNPEWKTKPNQSSWKENKKQSCFTEWEIVKIAPDRSSMYRRSVHCAHSFFQYCMCSGQAFCLYKRFLYLWMTLTSLSTYRTALNTQPGNTLATYGYTAGACLIHFHSQKKKCIERRQPEGLGFKPAKATPSTCSSTLPLRCTWGASLPEFGEMCKLLMSLDRPLVLGLEMGAQADVARGGLFPGTFTVVLRRSISLPWTFCM